MRVSDADRERAAETLREAAGDGRLTFDELDQRLGLAYAAKTYADLETVTSDLPATGTVAPTAARGTTVGAAGGFPAERMGGTPSSALSLAIMSGAQRAGAWVVPERYTAVAIMGGIELDLRQARFSAPTVTIRAFAFMGGIQITVPEDIDVDVSGIGFMGGFDHRASGPGVPGAPCVRIIGFAMMGGVDVRRRATKTQRRDGIERQERHGIERQERHGIERQERHGIEGQERRGIEDS